MKIKIAEATPLQLDWLVAKCEGRSGETALRDSHYGVYSPSTNWAQGGPIIEREGVGLHRNSKLLYLNDEKRWQAHLIIALDGPPPRTGYDSKGPTSLIAAMRCYVASKLGDEVEVPEDLK